jgi:hypothetical protein
MTTTKKLCLITGWAGVTCLALSYLHPTLGFAGATLGRISGLLYMIVIDKMRAEYLAPIAISIINIFVSSQSLLFTEMMVSAIIYQVSATRLFSKN